jgi:single-stranded-DNA-specific exonuclease
VKQSAALALQDEAVTHPAFLNVEQSLTGRRWHLRDADERLSQTIAQRHKIPEILGRAMVGRGLDLDTAGDFLDPKLRGLLPDPSRFKDMDKGAERFAKAIANNEKIAVFGDYDVDGGTSAALLTRFARAAGSNLRLYVPDRIKEGYGPNSAALLKLKEEGISLVVCVDCGTTAHEPLKAAQDAGLDVIVLDHHTAEPVLPPCVALVNPNRLDEDANIYGNLAAVGVTYLFIIAVNRLMRKSNWYNASRPEPDLLTYLDLVALGTICDVVRLTGLNRAYVTQGLRVLNQRRNVGLVQLAQAAGHKGALDTYAAGFILGPRVNAGGRVGQADLGARLLATDDPDTATGLATRLHQYNTERRQIEAGVLAEADRQMMEDGVSPIAFIAAEGWHPGVIGIVAARIKEKYNRPALVVSIDGDVGKGSGRSVKGIDLGASIIAARQAGLLINGGGHAMAAGFTVAKDKIEALKEFLAGRIGKQLEAEPMVASLTLDSMIAGPAVTPAFAKQLRVLGPFGTGNAEPRFVIPGCAIVKADVVGEKHVSCIVMAGGARLRMIAFRAMDNPLGQALLSGKGKSFHLAGCIRCDEWQGEERVQIQVEDAALA